MDALSQAKHLGDDELIEQLDRLAVEDHHIDALIAAHLLEVDKRNLYLDWGYPSLQRISPLYSN